MSPEELREWRADRRIRQTELADLLEVTPNTVWRWEHGEHQIPPFLRLALDHLDLLHGWHLRRGLAEALDRPFQLKGLSPDQRRQARAEARSTVVLRHPQEVGARDSGRRKP